MAGKAFIGRFHFDLEEALLREVEEARTRDTAAPVHILVGSNLLGTYLRRRLADRLGGLCNVHVLTFIDLLRFLESRARRALHPLPRFVERVMLGEVMRRGEVPPSFIEAAALRGFPDALLETFTDLAEGGLTPAAAKRLAGSRAPLGERTRAVLQLFIRFREMLESAGADIHTRFREAVEGAPGEPLESLLLVYGFYDFNEMQWQLLEALAQHTDVRLFIPWGEDRPYRFATPTVERCRAGEWTLGTVARMKEPRNTGRTHLLNMPGEEEEVREIARRILRLADEQDFRFDEIGVLVPAWETYRPLLREVLRDAHIPFFERGVPLTDTDLTARSVLRLVGLLAGETDRTSLVEFLVSAPIATFGESEAALWVRTSAESGMTGKGGWIEENERLCKRLLERAAAADEAQAAVSAAGRVGNVLEKLERARVRIESEENWEIRSQILAGLIEFLFIPSNDRERVLGVIEKLHTLDRLPFAASPDTFYRTVEHVINGTTSTHRRFLGGVNLLTTTEARGISFRALFLPGLAERIIPAAARQDPFLTDEDRSVLAWAAGDAVAFSAKGERVDEEALLFRLALDAAAEECVCSFPRFETDTGRNRIPSSFLGFLDGYSFGGEHGGGLGETVLTRGKLRDAEPISLVEYDRVRARTPAGAAALYDRNRFFARGVKLVKLRYGAHRFTQYDGVFSSEDTKRKLRTMLDERDWRFSPTALESYAGCPFAYFLAYLLGLEELEEPERIVTITPRQRGTLVHRALAALYRVLGERHLFPLAGRDWPAIEEPFRETVDPLIDAFPEHEPVGLPFFWEIEKRMIRESIRLLIEEEVAEGGEYVPFSFEEPFGRSRAAPITYDAGGTEIRFHGRIDRIDVGPENGFRVIDYKTGKIRGREQDIAGGISLQLPVYLLAAARMLERPLERGVALLKRVGAGGGTRSVSFSGERWGEIAEELKNALAVITRNIEAGLFFALPESDRCRFCDMRPACTSGRLGRFEQKAAGDDRCFDFLVMRGLVREE